MPDIWDFDDVEYTNDDKGILKYTGFIFSKNAPGADETVTKTLSLYRFLLKHLDTPVETLQPSIIINGAPMFTSDQLTDVLAKVRTQVDTPYAQRVLGQSAGGPVPAVPDIPKVTAPSAGVGIPLTPKPGHGLDNDPSRSKFWDKVIRKLMFPITCSIPSCMEPLLQWYFILYRLEQLEGYGPFISSALDTITLSIPVMADMAAEMVAMTVGLVPIPYASFAGDGLGYAVSLLFILVGVTMNNSRKHFGSSFKLALEAIPMVGEAASDGAQQIEIGAERYLLNRQRILDQMKKTMPTTAAAVEYYTPTPEIVDGPPPKIDLAVLKDEVGDKVESVTGVDVDELVTNPGAALQHAVESKVPDVPAVPTLPEVPKIPAVPELPAVPAVPTLPAVPELTKVPEMPAAPTLPTVPEIPAAPELPTLPDAPKVTGLKKTGGTRRFKRASTRYTRKIE